MHFHSCPECYEKVPCEMSCTICPDLEDPVSHPGKQFGSYTVCSDCQSREPILTQEWWDIYHGFKRKK